MKGRHKKRLICFGIMSKMQSDGEQSPVMLPQPVTSPGNSVARIKTTYQSKEDNGMKKNELQARVRYNKGNGAEPNTGKAFDPESLVL